MGFDVKEDEEVYSAPPPPKGFTPNCRGGYPCILYWLGVYSRVSV
jgi:hypothetical protein